MVRDFFSMAHSLFFRLDVVDRKKWFCFSWAIWAALNKFIFEGLFTPPAKVVEIGNSLWGDYCSTRDGQTALPCLS
jgi:hypothetical protein